MIHHGDCLEVMRTLPDASVDAIVTDPPYGLEFMGKKWDRLGDVGTTSHSGPAEKAGGERGQYGKVSYFGSSNLKCRKCGKWQWDHVGRKCECEVPDFPNPARHQGLRMQEWHYAWAVEALRVAKPGAYLLAFGGTRTFHRLAVALEDAGWIIRDTLVWGYASGFPKGRANLKPAWEPIVMARKPGPLRHLNIDECRIRTGETVSNHARSSDSAVSKGIYGDSRGQVTHQTEGQQLGRWPANVILTDEIFDGGIEDVVGGGQTTTHPGKVRGGAVAIYGNEIERTAYDEGAADSGTYSRFFLIPSRYNETCVLCGRASSAGLYFYPPSPSGDTAPSGAPTSPDGLPESTHPLTASPSTSATARPFSSDGDGSTPSTRRSKRRATSHGSEHPSSPAKSPDAASLVTGTTTTTTARWMCGTCVAAITSATTSSSPEPQRNYPWAFLIPKADRSDREPVLRGQLAVDGDRVLNSGSSGRTFRDGEWVETHSEPRKRANSHPTVKPTELMRHLVRLVTPPGGVILDPFLGSGTTAIAAEQEGFEWIGIEKEAEYVAIAEARLNGVQRGLGLDVPAPTQRRKPSKGRWVPPEIGSPSWGHGFKKGKRSWRERQEKPCSPHPGGESA